MHIDEGGAKSKHREQQVDLQLEKYDSSLDLRRVLVTEFRWSQEIIDSDSVKEHKGIRTNPEGHHLDGKDSLCPAQGVANLARGVRLLYSLEEV